MAGAAEPVEWPARCKPGSIVSSAHACSQAERVGGRLPAHGRSPTRTVKIHEYQAKTILMQHGVPIPRGEVTSTASQAGAVARRLDAPVVVKAQIHAGGRGKGGGIKFARNPEEAEHRAADVLGMRLVTPQTGPEGRVVSRVLVEEGLEISRELYLGIAIDRASARPVVMASAKGGVEIEKVARDTPAAIVREAVHPAVGLPAFQARKLAFRLGLEPTLALRIARVATSVYDAFRSTDASLVEVNPLVVTKGDQVLALDAKMNFDDNALFRHPEILELRDLAEEDELEREASAQGLSYIRLEGGIGCMVNGAGLAMATMDIVKLTGGEPANFLDVGGGARAEQIRQAFRILTSDHRVRAVLINIFGGILRCDVLAEGLIAAVRELNIHLPIVIRVEGTNADKGREMLRASGLNFTTCDTMSEAATVVTRLATTS